MQVFDSIHEPKNGKKYNTASNTTMSKKSSSEGSPTMHSTETNENEGPEIQRLTQSEIDEQIKSFITPPHEAVGGFGSACQGITTASHRNYHALNVVHPDINPISI